MNSTGRVKINAKCLTSHLTIEASVIFKIRSVFGCKHPNLDFDIKIFHIRLLLLEISCLESETPT